MKTEDYGLIYVLTNEYMPDIVKIGKTSKKDLKKRMAELFSTGVPYPFQEHSSCRVALDKLDMVEYALHHAFRDKRVHKNREFFRISPDSIAPLLNALESLADLTDVTGEVQKEIDNAVIADEKRSRRENMDFYRLNLKQGDTLTYTRDSSKVCIIVSNKTVEFEEMHNVSLSAVTRKLLGRGVQPALYWLAPNGQKLIELYKSNEDEE